MGVGGGEREIERERERERERREGKRFKNEKRAGTECENNW